VAQCHVVLREVTVAIGSAMRKCNRHRLDFARNDGWASPAYYSRDSTHDEFRTIQSARY
jgi:hypothetical protein